MENRKWIPNFEFQLTSNTIKDKDVDFAKQDIMCWDFEHHYCGTLYGDGIDAEHWTIDPTRVKFFNTSPDIRDSQKDLKQHFLDALKDSNSSVLTNAHAFTIIEK